MICKHRIQCLQGCSKKQRYKSGTYQNQIHGHRGDSLNMEQFGLIDKKEIHRAPERQRQSQDILSYYLQSSKFCALVRIVSLIFWTVKFIWTRLAALLSCPHESVKPGSSRKFMTGLNVKIAYHFKSMNFIVLRSNILYGSGRGAGERIVYD